MSSIKRGSCYVCGYTRRSAAAKGVHFHQIPSVPYMEDIRDSWLQFLFLPPTSCWTDDSWKNITLCSQHFAEGVYEEHHSKLVRVNLKKGAAPTLNRPKSPRDMGNVFPPQLPQMSDEDRPSGCGVLGELFSPLPDVTCSDPCSPPIAVSSQSDSAGKSDSSDDQSSIPIAEVATSESTDKRDETACHLKTQNNCKDNQEDTVTKQLENLRNLRKELCRLCGQRGSVLMPIFEPTSDMCQDMPVSSKIDKYLPIKVKLEDSLPFCICSNCLLVLNQWHELYTTCVAADALLSKTFHKESHMIGVNNLCTREIQRNAATQTEERPSDVFIDGTSKDEWPSDVFIDGTSTDEWPSDFLTADIGGNETVYTLCEDGKTGELLEDKFFKREVYNNYHEKRKALFKCHFCSELFRSSSDRRSHNEVCRQMSTICELCGYKVPCRKDLKKHKYRKHNAAPRKYLCDKCHKFFKSTSALKFHLQSIHGAEDNSRKYCCELCGAVFSLKLYFHLHKRRHEMGKVKTMFNIENFRQEVNSEDSENKVVYVCPVCQEKFNDMSSLAVHVNEKKKLKCSWCPKVMNCEKSLFLHVCNQWTCQYCLKSFDQRVKWLVHERWHTGEKPIKCRKCDQTFRSWHSRRYHEAKHEPSFHCPYCGKNFRQKILFQDHVSCHEGKEFSCHICNKKFTGREGLRRHIKTVHIGLKKKNCNRK